MAALKFEIFDVMHGDCIVIHFPQGSLGLVDSNVPMGHTDCPALEYMRDTGAHLKFVCLTHPHSDHFSGMMSVLEDSAIRIDEFWSSLSTGLETVLKFFNERSIPVYVPFVAEKMCTETQTGELLDIFDHLYKKPVRFDKTFNEFQELEPIEDVKVTALSPSTTVFKRYERTLARALQKQSLQEISRDCANRISLVLLFEYGRHRIILAGDAIRTNWQEIIKGARQRGKGRVFPVDLIKASHHGARDSFCDSMWQEALRDNGIVVVSSGGHRHPSVEFINSVGSRWDIYCTNRGECFGKPHYPEATRIGLDQYSTEVTDDGALNCFGSIEVEFEKDSDPVIRTEKNPSHESLPCRSRYRLPG